MHLLPLIGAAPVATPTIPVPAPDDGLPRPTWDLARSTLRAINRYATDISEARYLIRLAEQIGDRTYTELQARHKLILDNPRRVDGNQKYLDIPYWTAHKLSIARRLQLLSGPPRALLDLGTGAAHILRVAVDHGHTAIGIDIEDPIYADVARVLGVDRRVHRIDRHVKLPNFGQKFDVVTSMWIKYDDMTSGNTLKYWDIADWAFQLNDIVENQLKFPARIYFALNAQRRADGQYTLDQAVLAWFQGHGASIDTRTGEVELRLDAPRTFKP